MIRYIDGVNGNDGNDGTAKGVGAWKTLQAAAGRVDKHGDNRLIVATGEYAGANFYGDSNWVQGVGSLTFEFEAGARITSGTAQGHGLRVENWGGLVRIENADVSDVAGDGLFLVAVGRVELIDSKVTRAGRINVHFSEVLGGLVKGLESSYCLDQHGIYLGNGTQLVTVKGGKLVGNRSCGAQQNTDVRIRNPLLPARTWAVGNTFDGVTFWKNGRGGGADVNNDGGNGMRVLNCYFAGRAGGGSFITQFHSPYNSFAPSKNSVYAGNTFRGGGGYAVFNFGGTDHSCRITNNDIDVTPLPGMMTPKVIEFDGGRPAAGAEFVWEGNRYNGMLTALGQVLTAAELTALGIEASATAGVAEPELVTDFGGNPRPAVPALGAFEVGTSVPALPEYVAPPPPPPAPPVPPPPAEVLEPFPAEPPPLATPADLSKFDMDADPGVLCMEWPAQDRNGNDFTRSTIQPPPDGYWSETIKGEFGIPDCAMRFHGVWQSPVSGPVEVWGQGQGQIDISFARTLLVTGRADQSNTIQAGRFFTLAEGEWYELNAAYQGTTGDTVPSLRVRWRKPGDLGRHSFEDVLCRPYKSVAVAPPPPITPFPNVPPPPPGVPPTVPPPQAGGQVLALTFEQMVKLIHGS